MSNRFPPATLALLSMSILLTLHSDFGQNTSALLPFLIASPGSSGLTEIRNGELWRLLTPMFLHFSVMHLLFNMMAFWDLGRLIERRLGISFFTGFVLVLSAASNLVQFFSTGSALFGGMSGVLYGMFGYIWMRGRYDGQFSDDLQPQIIVMMLVWYALCWTGLLGPIANWAHTAGLLIGAVWGYASARRSLAAGAQPAAKTPARKSLQYLSTADMLELETHRTWVRDHCPSGAAYEHPEGKLHVIDDILKQAGDQKLPANEMLSLEIAFGDALTQTTGAIWATMVDRFSRTPVLLLPENPSVIFPAQMLRNWLSAGREGDIQLLFKTAADTIRQRAGKP